VVVLGIEMSPWHRVRFLCLKSAGSVHGPV
jgi:hypothetical protein